MSSQNQPSKHKLGERSRKLIGIVAVIIYLTIYCFVIAAIGEYWVLGHGVGWEIAFFAIAGFVWIFPIIKLFRWMDDLIKR